jgi:homoserine kinase type II
MRIPREVKDAASEWDLGRILACRRATRGVVNRNFILGTHDGKYVLRQVSRAHHQTPHDLEFELAYLDYLKHAGFPYQIPAAIATTKGSLFVTVQGHYHWLYKFLEGSVVEKLDGSHLAQLAKMMAEYHLLIERSVLSNGKPASDLYNRSATLDEIEEYRRETLRRGKINRNERIFLEESAKMILILSGFDDGPDQKPRLYPIHRDLISENLIWKHGKLVGVIDFEHVSGTNDPVVKDIAVTMQYRCRDRRVTHQLDIDSARQFLQSYTEFHPLPKGEIALIPDLITAGFLDDFAFALWMLRNDPDRAKRSEADGYGPTLFSKAAQWSHRNRERISQALLK